VELVIVYKNAEGEIKMSGCGRGEIRVKQIEGLGLPGREYSAAVYNGYDGQETLNSRVLPRTITMAVEFCCDNMTEKLRYALHVFSKSGYLFVKYGEVSRRIFCNQVIVADAVGVLKGQISSVAIQFVCDNPYFEDESDTVLPLYQRVKLLETPFSLPAMFGKIIIGAKLEISGVVPLEPVITLHYSRATENSEMIVITNETTGKSIVLDYLPGDDDTVVIDVKRRRITSDINGNILGYLSDDTFLGDFILENGVNVLTVDVGDLDAEFVAECRYNNLYGEAVIV